MPYPYLTEVLIPELISYRHSLCSGTVYQSLHHLSVHILSWYKEDEN